MSSGVARLFPAPKTIWKCILLTPHRQDVTALLSAAGNAIRALTLMGQTSSSQESSLEESNGPTADECKAAFTEQSAIYFSLVSSIQVNLQRNILGLDEAGIVNSKKAVEAAGGLGELDIGWLNSRNDKVGKEMEAELWGKAAALLRRVNEDQDDDEMMVEEGKI